jgi:predicted dehydrogenase
MRFVIVEVGHWHAPIHLRSFRLAGADIVGVSDHQPGVAQRFAAPLGCPAFTDYHVMLRETRPDFVVGLGRHTDMPAIARDLLATGLPLVLEKPLGLSAEQVAPLVEIARKQNAFVAVPLVNRYCTLWTEMDRLEQAGRVGVRSHAHFRVINGPPQRYVKDNVSWMLDPALSGGGCMRNLGIHTIDAFLRYAGGEEVEVVSAALTYRVYGRAVEEMGAALLRSKSGIIGTVEAGYSFASMTTGEYEWRVAAGNCYLVERDGGLRVATLDDDKVEDISLAALPGRYDVFGVDTLARLQAGRPPIAGLEDCYRAMRVLDDVYRKAVRTPHS